MSLLTTRRKPSVESTPDPNAFEELERAFHVADGYIRGLALLELPAARDEHQRLKLETEHRRVAEHDRQRAEEDAQRAKRLERKRPLAERLAAVFDQAAEINDKIIEIEHEEHLTLNPPQRISWEELARETPLAESRLGAWRRALATEYGWRL